MSQSLFQVYAAKKAAEIVYGVGEPTNMAVLTGPGVRDVPERAMDVLEHIRSSRRQFLLTDDESNELKQAISES